VRDGETLREAVETQARALIAGDLATFASYTESQALPRLYRAPRRPRARAFDILDIDAAGQHGRSEVRFHGRSSYILRGAWQRTRAGWKAVSLEIPGDSVRGPWWQRLLGLSSVEALPAREDLS
jgi:hypothetical protein